MTNNQVKTWHALGLAAVLGMLAMTGCSLYRNDRCYVEKDQYLFVRELYVQSGSIDLVERELTDMQWEHCKINESLYRLQKEFEVLPEVLPASTADTE